MKEGKKVWTIPREKRFPGGLSLMEDPFFLYTSS